MSRSMLRWVTFGLVFALACRAPNGVDDAGLNDANAVGCISGATEQQRVCPCPDGGGALTLACSTTDGICYAYNSTCVDSGFDICSPSSTGAQRALCDAFCDEHGEQEWAPCNGLGG